MDLLFVCLSDLHLGENDSVLTNLRPDTDDPILDAPSPTITALVNFLHALKRKVNNDNRIPYLVLNGDILELATATYPVAVATLGQFIKQLAQRRIFDRIVYLAGNHDHGLWSLMRDNYFLETLKYRPSGGEPDVDHVTPLSSPREFSALTNLASRLSSEQAPPPIYAANPAFRLKALSGQEYLFHHGHYLEHLYQALSLLRTRVLSDRTMEELKKSPLCGKLEQLEKDNWAWLDFVWSGFVRSGRTGQVAETIYEMLQQPEGPEIMIQRLGDILAHDLNLRFVPEFVEPTAFRKIIKEILDYEGKGSAIRRMLDAPAFPPELQAMTRQFLYHYLQNEMHGEGARPVPDKTTFYFGHTHKPFENTLNVLAFGRTAVVNTGGWVVEFVDHAAAYGPAVALGGNDGWKGQITFSLAGPDGEAVMAGTGGIEPTVAKSEETIYLQQTINQAAGDRRLNLRRRLEKTKSALRTLQG